MRVRSALAFPVPLKLELLELGSQAGAWEPAQIYGVLFITVPFDMLTEQFDEGLF